MYSNKFIIIIFAVVTFNLSSLCYSQDIENKLDSFFTTLSNQYHLNGCVLIADKGEVLYKNAFGYSDFNVKRKLTTNSMFELASISKQFTAMGIMMLCEKGLLNYSSNIRKFFPGLPYDSITIRNLLNHTSGLIDSEDLINRYWDRTKIITNEDILNLLREHQPSLLFQPGEKYKYSNTGYIILALIIEKVSGLTYGEYVKQNIFIPAGMERTMVYRRRFMPEDINDYAFGYVLSLKDKGYSLPDSVERVKRVITLDGLLGEKSISSTVEDLFKWDRCLYTNKLLSQETLQEAFISGKLNDGSDIDIDYKGHSYGFGWRVHNSNDGKMVWHTGHYPGYSNLIMRYVDIDRTIICLSNNGYEFYPIMNTINDILNNESVTFPLPFFAEQLRRMFIDNDISSIQDSIMAMVDNKTEYIIIESKVNGLGYDLLNLHRLNDAIAVFTCNTQLFPNSANVFDSLGEAYMKNGEYDLAVSNYKKSLELNPQNHNAVEMLKKIEELNLQKDN